MSSIAGTLKSFFTLTPRLQQRSKAKEESSSELLQAIKNYRLSLAANFKRDIFNQTKTAILTLQEFSGRPAGSLRYKIAANCQPGSVTLQLNNQEEKTFTDLDLKEENALRERITKEAKFAISARQS